MDYARRLDLADRYINSKSTKYKLRANLVEEAKATIGLFARVRAFPRVLVPDRVEYLNLVVWFAQDGPLDVIQNVKDVQTVWFELELADAYVRLGNPGMVCSSRIMFCFLLK